MINLDPLFTKQIFSSQNYSLYEVVWCSIESYEYFVIKKTWSVIKCYFLNFPLFVKVPICKTWWKFSSKKLFCLFLFNLTVKHKGESDFSELLTQKSSAKKIFEKTQQTLYKIQVTWQSAALKNRSSFVF